MIVSYHGTATCFGAEFAIDSNQALPQGRLWYVPTAGESVR